MTEYQEKCEKYYNTLKDQIKDDSNLEIFSSGTTGIPKKIIKKIKEEYLNKKGAGSTNDIWILTYSPERWSSTSILLHCIKNNSKIIFPKSLEVKDIIEELEQCTHVSMTPSLLKKIICFDIKKYQNIKQFTFGGEYAHQSIIEEAKNYFPKARISHVYATSELGDICSSSDGKEGYVFSKIKNASIIDGHLIIDGKETNDIWKLIDDRLCFVGRKGHVLNIGGETINLQDIEEFIIKNGNIRDGKYKIINAPIIGKSFIFEYVGDLDENKIRDLIKNKFSRYHLPLKFIKVDEIILGDTGKKVRV